jgi:predicted membrane protein
VNIDTNGPDGRRRVEMSFRTRREREPAVQIVIGLIVVALGVLFTLDNLHIVHARDYLRFWPAAFIAVGVAQLVQARAAGQRLAGMLWILVGGLMIANRLGWVVVRIWAYWPLLLVLVGARIFWRAFHRPVPQDLSGDADASLSMLAVLGGTNRRVVSQAFQHAEITAFMGGGKLDLRDATMAPGGAVIDVFAVMGGFEVLVPSTWSVDVSVTPFMGGYDDKTQPPTSSTAPLLRVRGFIAMGGLDIKNR